MVITIVNHLVEMVHHTRDHKTIKIFQIIVLDYNHLTIAELEIAQGDHSHVTDFVTLELILIHF